MDLEHLHARASTCICADRLQIVPIQYRGLKLKPFKGHGCMPTSGRLDVTMFVRELLSDLGRRGGSEGLSNGAK